MRGHRLEGEGKVESIKNGNLAEEVTAGGSKADNRYFKRLLVRNLPSMAILPVDRPVWKRTMGGPFLDSSTLDFPDEQVSDVVLV